MANTVLITGCSSGFGHLTARLFQSKGWNVVATMRSPEKETELTKLDNVLVTKLDVTNPISIENTVKETMDKFGSIDVLVNNAGYGGHTLFEQASDEAIRAMYETNVLGVMNVSRAVLPLMRKQNSGCIINVTSMAGMMGAPLISIYASTKHAVEGLTEAMSFEYNPLGIYVKSVLPGAYPTTRFNINTVNDVDAGEEEISAYTEKLFSHLRGVAEKMANEGGVEADPQEVADKIYECATSKTPVHNPVGSDAVMLTGMMGQASRQDFLDKLSQMVLPPLD